MSDAALPTTSHDAAGGHDDHGHGHGEHGHNPHLAHHFDTMEQQFDTGKLGMWVFLGTELLMFGGLFCAYAVYRSNHPEIFLYAHGYLDTKMGAINTAVLLASSLTMAWAVRCSQINKNLGLVICLLLTLLGGAGFMVIKAIEYNAKFEHHLGPGPLNEYNVGYKGEGKTNAEGEKLFKEELARLAPPAITPEGIATTPAAPYAYLDPNAAGGDASKITPKYTFDGQLKPEQLLDTNVSASPAGGSHDAHAAHGTMSFTDLDRQLSRQRVNTFFGIYYCMTGLHGVHVLVGMGLIFWILYRAANTAQRRWIPPLLPLFIGGYLAFIGVISHVNAFHYIGIPIAVLGVLWLGLRLTGILGPKAVVAGEFSESYYAPVDLVGLYWHLVDLIWIFLFPLLYLIHGKIGS